MRILRKRRKRPDRTILWPTPYKVDNKNLFFRSYIGAKKLRLRVRRTTGQVIFNENDLCKMFGFKNHERMAEAMRLCGEKKEGGDHEC